MSPARSNPQEYRFRIKLAAENPNRWQTIRLVMFIRPGIGKQRAFFVRRAKPRCRRPVFRNFLQPVRRSLDESQARVFASLRKLTPRQTDRQVLPIAEISSLPIRYLIWTVPEASRGRFESVDIIPTTFQSQRFSGTSAFSAVCGHVSDLQQLARHLQIEFDRCRWNGNKEH